MTTTPSPDDDLLAACRTMALAACKGESVAAPETIAAMQAYLSYVAGIEAYAAGMAN